MSDAIWVEMTEDEWGRWGGSGSGKVSLWWLWDYLGKDYFKQHIYHKVVTIQSQGYGEKMEVKRMCIIILILVS